MKQLIALILLVTMANVSRAAPSKEIYRTQDTTVTLLPAPPEEHVGAGETKWRHIQIVHRLDSEGEQQATVKIQEWEFIRAYPKNLDDDPQDELLVISRGGGSGPYYCLQIIDFTKDGFITTTSFSFGLPKVNNQMILLGFGEYEGAGTRPEYRSFHYRNGMVLPVKTKAMQDTVQQEPQPE